jgi:hypothetical protein
MQQKPANQEIDLLELLAKLFSTLKKNKILVILCPVVGLVFGLGVFYIKNTRESATASIQTGMMISTDLLSESEAKFLCNDFTTSDTLPGLTLAQRNKIISISTEIKKEGMSDGKIAVFIIIPVLTTDRSVLPALQAGLLKHIDQSEPVTRQRIARQKLYTEMIKKIDSELATLDLIKAQKVYPADLPIQITNLTEKKVNYQLALEGSNTVHLVKGFETRIVNEQAPPSKLPYVMLGLVLGICALVFILFLKFFRDYYRNFERARQ